MKKNTKTVLLPFLTCFLLKFSFLNGQNGPLYGSGNTITRVFDYQNFDNITIKDFDGNISIEIGQQYAIEITIDDNLEPRLRVEKEDEELNIWLDGNTNGKLYLEATNIYLKIKLPNLNTLTHRGNTTLNVIGISADSFTLKHNGNGNVLLEGESDWISILKKGNGNIDARNLTCLSAKVKSYGNGNVIVKANISLTANGTGNGNVEQVGKGKIDPLSGIVGNGKVVKIN